MLGDCVSILLLGLRGRLVRGLLIQAPAQIDRHELRIRMGGSGNVDPPKLGLELRLRSRCVSSVVLFKGVASYSKSQQQRAIPNAYTYNCGDFIIR